MVFNQKYILEELAPKIAKTWKETKCSLPDFLLEYGKTEKKENEQRLKSYKERIDKHVNKFTYVSLPGKKKKWKRKMEQIIDEILESESLLDVREVMSKDGLNRFKEQAVAFMIKLRKFDQGLGIEDVGQAFRNYIVYAVFRELNGLEQYCSDGVFGYSMLYPFTDNYIDNPEHTMADKEHYNQMIADVIQGKPFEALSMHEEKTAALLEMILNDYSKGDEVKNGLLYMLDAQKISQKQTKPEEKLDIDDILNISIYKGGMSVLIDRYLIDEPFGAQDAYFYFAFGFVLQMCDDIQDIAGDSREGARTLYTECRSEKETEEAVCRLLHFTKELFKSYASKNEGFKKFLMENTFTLILLSAARSREYVSNEWIEQIEGWMPMTADYLTEAQNSIWMLAEATSKEDEIVFQKKYMRMIDDLIKQ